MTVTRRKRRKTGGKSAGADAARLRPEPGVNDAEAIDGRQDPAWRWIAIGLALTTCATLLLELVATRIFSVALIYHFALILGGILIAAGVGSVLSARISDERLARGGRIWAGLVVVGALIHAVGGPAMIRAGLRWELPLRVIGTLITVTPLGLIMGMPLPLGVRMTERRAPLAIAWGWGVNGSLSVIGTILAMMVSVTLGMTTTILCGAFCYVVAALAASGDRGEPA